MQSFDLTGRVVVVTGALGRLGTVFCADLAAAGARVAALDTLPEDSTDVLRWTECQQRDACGEVAYVRADVTETASLETALGRIQGLWDIPFGLINNAGLDSPPGAPVEENGPFETYPRQSWERVLEVNLTGVMLCCQVFGGAMAAAGRGSIVNIGSIYGTVSPVQDIYEYRRQKGEVFYKPVAYAASKSGLTNLTRYLATYWARKGVRVNTLTLAGVFANQDEAFLQAYLARMPMGRMAEAADYTGALIFLMADASGYMTGAEMRVDGGWTAW